jgi:hypothetical protein
MIWRRLKPHNTLLIYKSMYTEITCIAFIGIILSLYKFRDIMHPHFVLTMSMFYMFYSDFILRGYDDPNIVNIAIEDVFLYQSMILALTAAIYIASYFLAMGRRRNITKNILNIIFGSKKDSGWVIPLFAILILALEIFKRLYSCDWSIERTFLLSFGPRFHRPWDSSQEDIGDGKFLFTLVGILLPLSGLIFSSDVFKSLGFKRLISIIGYILVLILVIGAGSRTPVVVLLVFPLVFYLRNSKSLFKKLIAILLAICLLGGSTSLLYNYRNGGVLQVADTYGKQKKSELVYHQDDTYYRLIHVLNVSSKTYERLDELTLIGASFLNFVPRAVWPEKPTVTRTYWGSYKPYYMTISFFGELTAVYGIPIASFISIVLGILSYLFLDRLYQYISDPYRLLLYILGCVYVYMVIRSMLNITQYMYMMGLFFGLLEFEKRAKRMFPQFFNAS